MNKNMSEEEIKDIKEKLDLDNRNNLNREAQEAYDELFNYINSLQQQNNMLEYNYEKKIEQNQKEYKLKLKQANDLLDKSVKTINILEIKNKELEEKVKQYEYNDFPFYKTIDNKEQRIKDLEERIEKEV